MFHPLLFDKLLVWTCRFSAPAWSSQCLEPLPPSLAHEPPAACQQKAPAFPAAPVHLLREAALSTCPKPPPWPGQREPSLLGG